MNGKSYEAKIVNVDFDPKFRRKKDTLQIRYQRDGELAKSLQACFYRSSHYIKEIRENRDPSMRSMIKVHDEMKEYLAIYTTEYDDCYVLETIAAEDMQILRSEMDGQPECVMEAHHIGYFVKSLNNDASNQMILCPNHHSIIHDANPTFHRRQLMYVYPNGAEQKIVLNRHL